METIKFLIVDPQKILVLCVIFKSIFTVQFKEREYYKHHMKTESITWSVTDSHSFGEMLDSGICNVTYKLDKIGRLLFELDYEVMNVTTQIFVNFSLSLT